MGIDSTSLLGHACLLSKAGNMRFSPPDYGTQRLVKISESLHHSLHLAIMCAVDILSASPSTEQVVKRLKQLQHPALSYSRPFYIFPSIEFKAENPVHPILIHPVPYPNLGLIFSNDWSRCFTDMKVPSPVS